MIQSHSFEVGGKSINLETGRVARQAGGSVLLGLGESVILGTATMSKNPKDFDFLPLTCDFEERKYAVGKIPGGVIKRGGRPSTKATLISRLIDRPIRPLFPKGCRNDIQVIAMPFSIEKGQPSDVLSITAAGAALALSDIPFNGPVAGVRVGLIDGEFILFPNEEQIAQSDLDLVVAGHKGAISMVEAGANEVSEEDMVKALVLAHEAIQLICTEIEKFAEKAGKPKRELPLKELDAKALAAIKRAESKTIAAALFNPDKVQREDAHSELFKELTTKYKEKYADEPEILAQVNALVDKAITESIRKAIIDDDKRPDGRKSTEIRPIEAMAGLLPRVHGSGLFTRGQTQVMTVCTLGMPKEAQYADIVDALDETETPRRYMHFYNFPPYSVGEARPLRGPGRREVGHGALAERALLPVIPLEDPDFPYTVHLISEVLESNGSSSMASVCGSTLALMDAGIAIKAPVAGIAMGLMSDGKTFKILTDIQGVEDFTGDMDFKVAGTRKGITALQLDTKLAGIPEQVLADALSQAKDARFTILDIIEAEIKAPRPELSGSAPRITRIKINPEKIGTVIGPGGATIRKITESTGCDIDVQRDGTILISSDKGEKAKSAVDEIKALTSEIEVGTEFTGEVTRLMGRGALVAMAGGRDGMVTTDQFLDEKIRHPEQVVAVGEMLNVKVHEVDSMGRVNLTAKGLNPDHPILGGHEEPREANPNSDRGDRGDRGYDRGGDRGRGGDRDRGRGRGGDRGDRSGGRPRR